MTYLLEKSEAYVVEARDWQSASPCSFEVFGRVLHATLASAKAARDEAIATGKYDEVRVQAYPVMTRGGMATAPVRLDEPSLYLVEAYVGLSSHGHWFGIQGDSLYQTAADAASALEAALGTGEFDEVILLRYPLK